MIHELKTWPQHFQYVALGLKRFEYRKDDRPYDVGDTLVLREWDPAKEDYTGDTIKVMVLHLLRGGVHGIPAGHVIMSIGRLR